MSRFPKAWTPATGDTCTVTQYCLPHRQVDFHPHYASEECGMSPSRRKNKTCERVNELRLSQPLACNWCCGAVRVQFNRVNLLYLQLQSHYSDNSGQETETETPCKSPSLSWNSHPRQNITPPFLWWLVLGHRWQQCMSDKQTTHNINT